MAVKVKLICTSSIVGQRELQGSPRYLDFNDNSIKILHKEPKGILSIYQKTFPHLLGKGLYKMPDTYMRRTIPFLGGAVSPPRTET